MVESQPELLEAMSVNLRDAGYDVITAANGLQALRQAGTGHADIIMLDLKLPDISGDTVCDILRRLPSTAGVPMILVIDPTDESICQPSGENGALESLVWPFTAIELISKVKETLLRHEEALLEADAPDLAERELPARWE